MTAKKRLRIAALAVTLTVGASLTACGDGAESSGVTEIRYSARLTGVGDDADAAIVEAFNKKFEGRYRVTRTAIDDETYKTKQITQLTGVTRRTSSTRGRAAGRRTSSTPASPLRSTATTSSTGGPSG